jgi:hypothetical protein
MAKKRGSEFVFDAWLCLASLMTASGKLFGWLHAATLGIVSGNNTGTRQLGNFFLRPSYGNLQGT